MLSNWLKQSDDLITWWKLEWGVTVISFSFLTVIVGVATEWEIPSFEEPISVEKMMNDKPILIFVVSTVLILVSLFIVGIFKCFKVLGSLNILLKRINEENIQQILKKSKALLTIIICLTLFPLIILIPQVTSVLFFGVTICKFFYYQNNKKICELVNNKNEN